VLIPLVGGLAGMFFAILLGYVTTKKASTTFAMITLGVGELVAAMALMFPEFFGGEGGITTDRVYGTSFFGITFGPGIQVYYLIAVYCFVCTAAMFAFTGTPLGRMLNAVRDNPERVSSLATTRSACATSPSSSRASLPALAGGWRPSTSRSSPPPTA
jgi:branched-chain amino acid transport system permease protein